MVSAAARHVEASPVQNLQRAPGNDGAAFCTPYPSSLPVCVRFGGRDRRRSAVDVSDEGMFVESPDHLPPGELVQVLIAIPGDSPLRALATVERVVSPDEAAFCGGMPGMGLRFFMMDARLSRRWAEYLEVLRAKTQPLPADPEASEHRRDAPVKLTRRDQTRKDGRFRVRAADAAGLQAIYTTNISRGGMFLATDELQPIGTRLRLAVEHPVTGREFPLEVEVRWVQAAGSAGEQGIGVQLVSRDLKLEEAFLRFVNAG